MIAESFHSYEAAAAFARDACGIHPVSNLLLAIRTEAEPFKVPFNGTYEDEARAWQSPIRPAHLHLNHGEYMHRYGDGLGYVQDQLSRKPTSRRAVISLIDSSELIDSQDDPRPSFLVFQAACEEDNLQELKVSAYYRAIEVTEFLPLNLTELALMSQAIVDVLPAVESIECVVHAFHAYSEPGFQRLSRWEVNVVPQAAIRTAVAAGDKQEVDRLVASISGSSTAIDLSGLTVMIEAVAEDGTHPLLKASLDDLLRECARLRELRRISSRGNRLSSVAAQVDKLVTAARNAIWSEGNDGTR